MIRADTGRDEDTDAPPMGINHLRTPSLQTQLAAQTLESAPP
jgi:hypothetical protein